MDRHIARIDPVASVESPMKKPRLSDPSPPPSPPPEPAATKEHESEGKNNEAGPSAAAPPIKQLPPPSPEPAATKEPESERENSEAGPSAAAVATPPIQQLPPPSPEPAATKEPENEGENSEADPSAAAPPPIKQPSTPSPSAIFTVVTWKRPEKVEPESRRYEVLQAINEKAQAAEKIDLSMEELEMIFPIREADDGKGKGGAEHSGVPEEKQEAEES